MNKKITLLALKCLFVLAFTQMVNAQQIYTNGGLSTGATSNNGTLATPTGYTWSELQNNTGNTTEANVATGINGHFITTETTSNRLADNFVVPVGAIWNITSFDFFCFQTGYTGTVPPIDALRVQIFNGDPSAGGTLVAGNMTTNVYDAVNSTDELMYRTANSSVPANLTPLTTRKIWKVRGNLTATLPAGTYWVVYQMHAISNTACLSPYVTVVGSRGLAGWNAKSQNAVTSVWSSLIDLGSPAASPDVPQDLPFNINGTIAPTNDICSGAIALTPGATFSSFPLTSTNLNATTTAGLTPSCQSSVSNDVWYSVVVPASGNITIEAQANGGLTDSVIEAYSGTCSTTLTPVGCNDNQGANTMSKLSLTGQTPGTTLLISLWRYSLGTGVNGTFIISAYDTPPPPSNNNCSGAIVLTPGVTFSSFPLTSTNLYATTTAGLTPSCQSSVSNDVWYSVVVPASGNITIEAQANGGLTDSVIEAYSGTCSTTLTPVGCNDNQGVNMMSKLSLTGQTPGTTLLISLWRYSLGTGVDGTFIISAYDTPPPPSNNNCSGAIVLTPGITFSSFPLTSTNLYATTTAGLTPSCQSSIVNDVWYSVVVPTSGNITIEAQANGGLTDSVIAAYSGTCSTTLTPVGCNDNQGANMMSKLSVTGQTPGTTLLISLWRYSLGTGVDGTFIISAYDNSPPSNNNCTGAIALTPGGVFADNTLNSTNLYATTNVSFIPSCQSSVVNDVWYSVVVPASGNITIEAQANGGLTDSVIVAYSGGTCGPALTAVGCNDNQGANTMSKLSVTGQTPGSTLFIALWRYSLGTGVDGTFLISAYDASLANNTFSDEKFIAYPNPVKDILNLSYSKEILNVEVYNILGQQVIAKTINATQSQVDMSQLAPGTYMVKVFADNQEQTIKVIKQ